MNEVKKRNVALEEEKLLLEIKLLKKKLITNNDNNCLFLINPNVFIELLE